MKLTVWPLKGSGKLLKQPCSSTLRTALIPISEFENLVFFDRTIRKVTNWNQSWVLICGTPCKSFFFYNCRNWKTQVIIASIASGTISTSAKPVWKQGCHPNILMKYLQGHHHQQYYPERLLKSTLNWTLHIQWQVPQKFLEDHSETKPRSKLVDAATQNHRTPQVIHLQDNQVKCQTSYQ